MQIRIHVVLHDGTSHELVVDRLGDGSPDIRVKDGIAYFGRRLDGRRVALFAAPLTSINYIH